MALTGPGASAAGFESTHWSLVSEAQNANNETRRRSFELLLASYWRPIYAYLRQAMGLSRETAEDATQDFMLHLVEGDLIPKADPARGRFRAYVKVALRNFVIDRRRFDGSARRGGEHRIVSMDLGEDSLLNDVPAGEPPDVVLDRQWAQALMQSAISDLEARLRREGRASDWELFSAYTDSREQDTKCTYAAIGARFGLTESQVGKRLMAVRALLSELIRSRVRETVADGKDVEDEMKIILDVLG